jgi:mediator of RNA polymerase II transcription subunit 21
MATQFYSALHYLNTNHNFVTVNENPSVADPQRKPPSDNRLSNCQSNPPPQKNLLVPPNSRRSRTFMRQVLTGIAAQKELSRDLILKTKEIELLISSLPGIGVSEAQQITRLEKLEGELQAVEKRRKEVMARKEELQQRLDEVIEVVAINSRGTVNFQK